MATAGWVVPNSFVRSRSLIPNSVKAVPALRRTQPDLGPLLFAIAPLFGGVLPMRAQLQSLRVSFGRSQQRFEKAPLPSAAPHRALTDLYHLYLSSALVVRAPGRALSVSLMLAPFAEQTALAALCPALVFYILRCPPDDLLPLPA